jgi:hypothetical protein
LLDARENGKDTTPRCLFFLAEAAQQEQSAISTQQQQTDTKNHMFSGDAFVNMYYFAIEI